MHKNLIEEAIKCLSLADIRLRTTSVEIEDNFSTYWKEADEKEENLEIQFSNSINQHRVCKTSNEQNVVEYFYDVAFRLRNKNSNNHVNSPVRVIAEIKATFSAIYAIDPEKDPNEEALIEFGKYNVGFNIWPFWREYASSTANRIGLPTIIVPLYNMPKEADE